MVHDESLHWKKLLQAVEPEFTDAARIPGAAVRALNGFIISEELCPANLLRWIGRGDAVCTQLFFSCFRHPVCCPGG